MTKVFCNFCGNEMPSSDKCFYLVDEKTQVVFAINPWAKMGYLNPATHNICDDCGAKALERAKLMSEDEMKVVRKIWNNP